MSTLSRRRATGAARGWLPVVGVVAALFLVPSSNGEPAAREASLSVSPGSGQYGGTSAHWEASGLPANARAHLERRGTTGAAWADVDGSFGIGSTDARGHIEFSFPTPAMNSVYFRVVAGGAGTEAHHFLSKQPEARISVVELDPMPGAPLPQGVAEGTTVTGEPFSLSADTAFLSDPNPDRRKPVIEGRDATLERRTVSGGVVSWEAVDTDQIGPGGKLTFGVFEPGGLPQQSGDYRVRLEDWTKGGDDIGSFLSFPFDLRVVDRPSPVTRLVATAIDAYSVKLSWVLPTGSDPDKIVITRSSGGAADLSDTVATLPGTATSYVDGSVFGPATYGYAVYTVSGSGSELIYTRDPATATVTTPAPRGQG